MRKVVFYEKLGEHLHEHTFDMREETEGYPTIHWVITRSMLDGYPEFERYQLMASYVTKVKNSLDHAIRHLEERGVPVYRSIPKGSKNIQFITTDPDYMEAKQEDYQRQTNRILNNLKSYGADVARKHPDRLSIVGGETKRLTNKLETTL